MCQSPRARLLAAASELLSAAVGAAESFTVTITAPGASFSFSPCTDELDRPGTPDGLSPMERAVLAVATSEPEHSKRIAAKMGKKLHGGIREALRSLVRKGLLAEGPDGYRLPLEGGSYRA